MGQQALLASLGLSRRERGLLLHFVELPPEAEAHLQEMIQPLPELPDPSEADEPEASDLIVSEIR